MGVPVFILLLGLLPSHFSKPKKISSAAFKRKKYFFPHLLLPCYQIALHSLSWLGEQRCHHLFPNSPQPQLSVRKGDKKG